MQKSCLLRKDFDFRRNSRPTVPLYADRRELLGFRNFFNSLPACRKGFFDTLFYSIQSMGASPFSRKKALILENGLLPKNPR